MNVEEWLGSENRLGMDIWNKSIGMKKRILKAGLHVSAAEMKKSQST